MRDRSGRVVGEVEEARETDASWILGAEVDLGGREVEGRGIEVRRECEMAGAGGQSGLEDVASSIRLRYREGEDEVTACSRLK